MDRAVLAFALVACGARTDLGGARPDASAVDDAPADVAADIATDVTPSSCPPVVYVSDEQSSTSFAIDDTAVYLVMDTCEVLTHAKDGTVIGNIWFMDAQCAGEIVVDDQYVYWTSGDGSLMRHLKDGTSGNDNLGCAALNGCPGNVHVRAVAKDVVVLVDGFRPVAMPKAGGSPWALVPNGFAPPAPVHYVFTDDARAYWNNDIRVFSSVLDGSTLPLQYAAASSGLAIDSSHVFWTANGGGGFTLFRADKDGANTTTLGASDTSTPIIANDAFVFGVSPSGITRRPTSGASAPTVIVPSVHPLALALDASCIYFAEKASTGRRIARAPN